MTFLERFDGILARIESAALIFVLSAMVLIAFLQVVLRNFFSYSILWGDVLLRHLVLWIGFLGASLATRENKHINVDVFSRLISQKKRHWVKRVTNLFSAFICALLSKAAYVFVQDERAAGTTIFLDFPLWIFMLIIFIGFVCITFRFLLQVIEPIMNDQDK